MRDVHEHMFKRKQTKYYIIRVTKDYFFQYTKNWAKSLCIYLLILPIGQ